MKYLNNSNNKFRIEVLWMDYKTVILRRHYLSNSTLKIDDSFSSNHYGIVKIFPSCMVNMII